MSCTDDCGMAIVVVLVVVVVVGPSSNLKRKPSPVNQTGERSSLDLNLAPQQHLGQRPAYNAK